MPTIFERLKKEKQDLIKATYLELQADEIRLELYRAEGGGDYNHFCWEFQRQIIENPEIQDLISLPVDKASYPPEVYLQIMKRRKLIGEKMVNGDYQAPLPSDKISLISDLLMIWDFYENSRFLPERGEMCLDLAMMKLLSAAHRRIGIDFTRAEREEPRKAKIIKSKKENLARDDHRIIKAFHNLIFSKAAYPNGVSLNKAAYPNGVSLNKAANKIHAELKNKLNPPPCIDTIKRALRRNEQIWSRFKKVTVKGGNRYIMQI